MSFTFTSLKQAIQDFTENSETSFVTNLPVFIRTAEERILKFVDLDFFRKNVTAAATANNKYLAVPSDYLSTFSLSYNDNSGNKQFLLLKDVNFLQTYIPTETQGIARTFTVTVEATDSGNVYVIDGVRQASLVLYAGGRYRFDQSDASNTNHPFRFSTTSNGTHAGGTIYSTGVDYQETPGSANAATEITIAEDTPDLYYFCTNHSGMGGSAATKTSGAIGLPKYYANFDVDNFLLSPTPDDNYEFELHYFYRPASITTDDTGTSWVGTNAPNTLLYGSLVEAYIYMKGEADIIKMYEDRFQESILRLRNYGEGVENVDAYRNGLLYRPRT